LLIYKKNYEDTHNEVSFPYYAYLSLGKIIFSFIEENIRFCNKRIFAFVGSFFTVLFFYNIASIFPFLEEPTKNLNVALAFALYGFFYIQYIAFREDRDHYIGHWITRLVKIKNVKQSVIRMILYGIAFLINSTLTLILLPFHLLERVSLIFSLTFRLFGNMFGGSIVIHLLQKLQQASLISYFFSTVLGIQLLVFFYFGLFEGGIQAFVFTLVLINNIGMLINKNH
jgi:F-type H+-transporting ATPase subunit a